MEGGGDDTYKKNRGQEEGGASVFVTPCLLVAATLACSLSQLGVDLAGGLPFTVGLFLSLDFIAFRWVCVCIHVCMCRDGRLCAVVVEEGGRRRRMGFTAPVNFTSYFGMGVSKSSELLRMLFI